MIADLTEAGYRQTQHKLANMQRRLAEVQSRSDLDAAHREAVIGSYCEMIRQYLREIKLYEEKHLGAEPDQP